jgi:hypothetical protein
VCRRPAHRGDGFWLPGKGGAPYWTNDPCPGARFRLGSYRSSACGASTGARDRVQGSALVAEGTRRITTATALVRPAGARGRPKVESVAPGRHGRAAPAAP